MRKFQSSHHMWVHTLWKGNREYYFHTWSQTPAFFFLHIRNQWFSFCTIFNDRILRPLSVTSDTIAVTCLCVQRNTMHVEVARRMYGTDLVMSSMGGSLGWPNAHQQACSWPHRPAPTHPTNPSSRSQFTKTLHIYNQSFTFYNIFPTKMDCPSIPASPWESISAHQSYWLSNVLVLLASSIGS
jgi:hypothetical protein